MILLIPADVTYDSSLKYVWLPQLNNYIDAELAGTLGCHACEPTPTGEHAVVRREDAINGHSARAYSCLVRTTQMRSATWHFHLNKQPCFRQTSTTRRSRLLSCCAEQHADVSHVLFSSETVQLQSKALGR